MKKNQKIITLISAFVLILVFVVFLVFSLLRDSNYQQDLDLTTEQKAETQETIGTIDEGLEMENRQIKVEMATEEELAEIGLVTDTPEGKVRIQVIERDENGKIISYKIIRRDEDIVNEINVPKRGFFTEGGEVPFLEE